MPAGEGEVELTASTLLSQICAVVWGDAASAAAAARCSFLPWERVCKLLQLLPGQHM